MKTEHPRVYSNDPLPPGRILRREIEYRGVSRNELARQMGRPVELVNRVINADTPVTPDIARAIEKALGIKAYLWTNLEASYRATLAHNEQVATDGPNHTCDLGEDCPTRQTYDDDEEDEYEQDAEIHANFLMDEGD